MRRAVPAAAALAAMDYDATDGPSVDALGIDYRWPEPGEPEMNVDLATQLYWPRSSALQRKADRA